jgi:hypothetical protein
MRENETEDRICYGYNVWAQHAWEYHRAIHFNRKCTSDKKRVTYQRIIPCVSAQTLSQTLPSRRKKSIDEKTKFRRRAKPTEIQLVYIPSDSINICLTVELKVFV